MDRQKCKLPALVRYTWPGKDEALACLIHADQINKVANAIGLHLQMIELSEQDRLACLECQSEEPAEEKK